MAKFWNWFLLAEKEHEEKFEAKHKRSLNIIRIVGVILIISLYHLYYPCLLKLLNFPKKEDFLIYVIALIISYLLIVFYKAWMKGFWDFLKKDSIVQYIFLAIIPAAILFFGYQYVHVNTSRTSFYQNPTNGSVTTQTDMTLKEEYDEIIDRLNGFYAALFTAIAVIAALIGLGAWRSIKEMKEKLERFKKIEDDVDFLKKKKDLADWVQSKFEKDADKSTITSISFDLTEEENARLKEIEKKVLEDTTDDSWLKLVYAWQLLEEKQKNKPSKEDDFIKIESIYDYIEKRDLLKETSVIKQKLYHLQGLTYWFWYENKKAEFLKKYSDKNVEDIPWIVEWWKKDKGREKLEKSVKYYEKTHELCKKKEVENVDETLGNLAVVLIELSKFKEIDRDERKDCLYKAKKHLEDVKEKTFNTYWDHARLLYYEDYKTNIVKIKNLMDKVDRKIVSKSDKDFYENSIENEKLEIGLDGKRGFPVEIESETKEEKMSLHKILSWFKFRSPKK